MKLILMTRPEFFVEEHQILTALFDEGLDTLHLRKPNSEPVYSERLLSLIPDGYRKKIVVHDHFYLKQEYGLKGIHLSNRNAEVTQNYKGHISCSCHNAQELSNASSFSDYMFLGPLYDSLEQDELNSSLSQSTLRQLAQKRIINKKVMAFGGLGLDDISELRDFGFGGFVILGDIWNRFNIHTSCDYRDVVHHFRKLRKAVD